MGALFRVRANTDEILELPRDDDGEAEEPDPRLELTLDKTWREMSPEERAAERKRQEETTRMLEERIAYYEARRAGRGA
jgi:hypothetical protein